MKISFIIGHGFLLLINHTTVSMVYLWAYFLETDFNRHVCNLVYCSSSSLIIFDRLGHKRQFVIGRGFFATMHHTQVSKIECISEVNISLFQFDVPESENWWHSLNKGFLKSLNNHSLILEFVYAHRAGWNGQIGSVWRPWKIFVYAVLFWAKKASEITLCNEK